MDIVHLLHDLGGVMQILHGAVAIVSSFDVYHVDRGTRGSEMDICTGQMHVVFRITPIERYILGGFAKHFFDQATWEPQSAIIAQNGSDTDHRVDTRLWRINQSDFFKRDQRCFVNGFNVRI